MGKVKLSDICNPKQWKAISTSDLLNEGYPVYGANGIIGYYNEYNHENPVVTVTCRGATCGSINITVPKAYVTGNAMCLDDLRSDVEIEYLYYCLKHYDFKNIISGSAQPQITRQGMEKIYIMLCSQEEQKDIVNKLKKTEKIIKLTKQELQSLDNLIKARFIELFGDYINEGGKPLSELATITGGLTKNSKRNTFNLKMPYLRVANVFFNRLDLNEILEIGVREDEIGKTLLETGDLLFVEGNGSIEQIGRVAIWDGSINQILHQNHLIKARFHKKTILPEFALFYFMSQEGRQQIISKSVSTSGLNTLSVNKISSLILPMPPIELQERFAAFVTQVDKSKVKVQKALDETQKLFDSLMQQYFG